MASFLKQAPSVFGFIFFSFFATTSQAQIEIGLFGGGFNYQGDLDYQPKVLSGLFVPQETKLAYGIVARYTPIPKLSIRANFIQSKLAATDRKSPEPRIRYRGFTINTTVREFSVVGEWNILGQTNDNNFNAFSVVFNPYLFTGIGFVSRTNDPTAASDNGDIPLIEAGAVKSMASIPFGGGAKLQFSDKLSLGLELGTRMVLSDYLDGVSKNGSPSRDWYIFGGLSLTYCFSTY